MRVYYNLATRTWLHELTGQLVCIV